MNIQNKNIGIWGFGIVGKAAASYLHNKCNHIEILDKRALSEEEQATVKKLNATWIQGQDSAAIETFIVHNDYIIVSPGVDTRPYAQFSDKFIAELDLFGQTYKKPVVAITGSVGKTTITHLLAHIIRSYDPQWWMGGNIGTGVLDILETQDKTEGAIVEVSSFQLDQCRTFAPDLAIITNVYPNHLDRHGSFQGYLEAKAKIFTHQREDQSTLIPLSLRSSLNLEHQVSSVHFFSLTNPGMRVMEELPSTSILFFIDDNRIKAYNDGKIITLVDIKKLPTVSFLENWLIICSVLFISQLPVDNLIDVVSNIPLPEHRLEHVATINGIDFYDDSKGTTTAATLAAVEKLKSRPIILMLGGLGKGVDRSAMIKQLKGNVKAIVCFGDEREALANACRSYGITYELATTVEQALSSCMAMATAGDQIVLSPAGTSYDQFKNYQERGNFF